MEVDGLRKRYRLGVIGGATLADEMKVLWARLRGRPNPLAPIGQEVDRQREGEYFWALQGVSFQVRKGEILGIVGKNGAGKSTLLKLLSRITTPTEGEIRIKGRTSSLLEVGTGFHPELTGRENIFLNGAILGMDRAEIARKMDEIVAFSGIMHHIDTPVKRYSSGMKVRLGFAVAAHLEPEILIIDEVLAVGDAEFQRKCIGKMKDVAGSGRTVLFVSHNMTSVRSLCDRVIWLKDGLVHMDGGADEVVKAYLSTYTRQRSEMAWAPGAGPGDERARLLAVRLKGPEDGVITRDDAFRVEVELENSGFPDGQLNVGLFLVNDEEVIALGSSMREQLGPEAGLQAGRHHIWCEVPDNLLNVDEYRVVINLFHAGQRVLHAPETIAFEIHPGKQGEGYFGSRKGVVRPRLAWGIGPAN